MTENNKVEGKYIVEGESWFRMAEAIKGFGYGKWQVELTMHKGKCRGYKQIKAPEIEFREYQG